MAFVYQSKRDLNPKTDNFNVGPGSYVKKSQQQKKNFVPFNSTYQKEKTSLSNQPAIQYQDESKIQNINQLFVQNQTSSFKSQQQRFKQENKNIPGPGYYQNNEKQKIDKQDKNNARQELIQAKYNYKMTDSIPNKTNYIQNNSEELDIKPMIKSQSYYEPQQQIKQQKISHWDYDNSKKHDNIYKTGTNKDIGPGCYDLNEKYKSELNPQYQFKSQTKRDSITDNGKFTSKVILEKFKQQVKILTLEDKNQDIIVEDVKSKFDVLLNNQPGPGYYFNNQETKSKQNEQYQFFGSSSKRFRYPKQSRQVGPCDYDFHIQNQKPQGKFGSLSKNKRFVQSYQNNKPGPGYYDPQCSIEHNLIKNIQNGYQGNFGTKQKRPFDQNETQDQPGPGSYIDQSTYMSSRIIQIQKYDNKDFIQVKNETSKDLIDHSDLLLNLTQDNISKQTINVVKKKNKKQTPFLCKQKRFDLEKKSHNMKQSNESLFIEDQSYELQSSFDKQIYPKSKTKFDKAPRFKKKSENIIGPGEYYNSTQNNLKKKTYNVTFLEKS